MLYVKSLPKGAVIVSDALGTAQVACVAVTVGAAGVAGCALIVTVVGALIQPAAFFTVTLYVPAGTSINLVAD